MSVVLPDRLLDAVRRRKCILFAGSGLSIAAGHPTWEQVVSALVARAREKPWARTEGLEKFERAKDLLALAEFARRTLGPALSGYYLRRLLSAHVAPTPAHDALAGTNFRGVVTTNYDNLLETSMTLVRGDTPPAFASDRPGAIGTALLMPDQFVFKLHGDLPSPETIVLSAADYDRLVVNNPHVRVFLQAVFLNHVVLFVGYGLRDPDFQMLMRELSLIFQHYTPTHFALLPDAGAFEQEYLFSGMNIEILPYDSADHHRVLTEVLQALRDEAPYQAPFAEPRVA